MEEGEVRGRREQRGRELWGSGEQEVGAKGPPWGRVLLPRAAHNSSQPLGCGSSLPAQSHPSHASIPSLDTDVKHIPWAAVGQGQAWDKCSSPFWGFSSLPRERVCSESRAQHQGCHCPSSKGTRTVKSSHSHSWGRFSTEANRKGNESQLGWGPEDGNFLLLGHDLLWDPKFAAGRTRVTGQRGGMKCWSSICPWLQQGQKGWLRFIK